MWYVRHEWRAVRMSERRSWSYETEREPREMQRAEGTAEDVAVMVAAVAVLEAAAAVEAAK